MPRKDVAKSENKYRVDFVKNGIRFSTRRVDNEEEAAKQAAAIRKAIEELPRKEQTEEEYKRKIFWLAGIDKSAPAPKQTRRASSSSIQCMEECYGESSISDTDHEEGSNEQPERSNDEDYDELQRLSMEVFTLKRDIQNILKRDVENASKTIDMISNSLGKIVKKHRK